MLVAVLRLLAVVVVVVVVVELVPPGVDDDDDEDSAAVEGHWGRRMNSNGAVMAVYQRLPRVVSEICFGAQQVSIQQVCGEKRQTKIQKSRIPIAGLAWKAKFTAPQQPVDLRG